MDPIQDTMETKTFPIKTILHKHIKFLEVGVLIITSCNTKAKWSNLVVGQGVASTVASGLDETAFSVAAIR